MKIGTDVSLATCRDEGYMVIEFKKRELIKKGVLQKDVYVECTQSLPYAGFSNFPIWQNGRPCIPGALRSEIYSVYDISHSWETILEVFEDWEEGILSMCGCKSREDYFVDFDNPTEYDLLSLISDVCSYGGLE